MNELLGVLLVSGRLTHQESYAREFARDPRCRLVALTDEKDVREERACLNRELAEELGIPYVPSLDEALSRTDIHLVSVCAEPERRGRILTQCARAGKHLYIDKPMTPSLSIAYEIAEAVKQNGVASQMFSTITQPWARQAKQVIESGELGELLAAHADCLVAKGHAGTATLGRRRTEGPPEQFTFVDSKPELYDMGIYAIAMVRWLTGREIKTVYAQTANYFFEAHQRNDVEDFGVLAMTLEGGLAASATGGRIGWTSHPSTGLNQVHLVGSRGSVLVQAHGARLEVFANEPHWKAPEEHPLDPMGLWRSTQREVNTQTKKSWISLYDEATCKSDQSQFVDCILEGRKSELTAEDAAVLTEVILAAYKSAADREVVHLPLGISPQHKSG